MKILDRSKIFKNAWFYVKNKSLTLSKALKEAWRFYKKLTMNQLAEIINRKIWSNSQGIERIYINDWGFNTKKAKTTTYLHIIDGLIHASVSIFSSYKHVNWCKSKENIAKENLVKWLESEYNLKVN